MVSAQISKFVSFRLPVFLVAEAWVLTYLVVLPYSVLKLNQNFLNHLYFVFETPDPLVALLKPPHAQCSSD